MRLLSELNDKILTESKGKDLYFSGIAIQANLTNGNGRFYPLAVAESAVNKYVAKHLSNNTAVGELDHPTENISKINVDRISHRFTEIKRDGNNFITKAKILQTTCGKQVKNLINGGVKLGMSSRGFGKTKNKAGVTVVEELFLVTPADIVSEPSAPDAWGQSVYEKSEFIWKAGELVEANVEPIFDQAKRALKNKSGKTNTLIEKLFNEYMRRIKLI